MYANLKFSLLLACLTCAVGMLTSCGSDSGADDDPVTGTEVTFNVENLSRAQTTTSFDRFAVYGDMKLSTATDATPTVVFDKTEVVYSKGKWSYSGQLRYWFPRHEHSFVAIYPISVIDNANNPLYSDSQLTFDYSLPITQEGTVNDEDVADIVAATHRRFYQENEAAGVTSLTFGHLLSLVNFTLELNDPTMKSTDCFNIHKIEISGFGTSAQIGIKPSSLQTASQTADSDINIVTEKGDGRISINFATPIKVTNRGEAIKMFKNNNALIMLPQAFSNNEEVKIGLTYSLNEGAETIEASATLNNFRWESSKSYIYTLQLGSDNKMLLINNAQIKDWVLVDGPNEVDAR